MRTMPGPHITVRKKSDRPLEQAPQAGSVLGPVRSCFRAARPAPCRCHPGGATGVQVGQRRAVPEEDTGFPERGSGLEPNGSCRPPGPSWVPGSLARDTLAPRTWRGSRGATVTAAGLPALWAEHTVRFWRSPVRKRCAVQRPRPQRRVPALPPGRLGHCLFSAPSSSRGTRVVYSVRLPGQHLNSARPVVFYLLLCLLPRSCPAHSRYLVNVNI